MPWLPELVSIYPAKAREERGKTRREREASESMRKAALAADFSSRSLAMASPFRISARDRSGSIPDCHSTRGKYSARFSILSGISLRIFGDIASRIAGEQPQERIRNPV